MFAYLSEYGLSGSLRGHVDDDSFVTGHLNGIEVSKGRVTPVRVLYLQSRHLQLSVVVIDSRVEVFDSRQT